VLRHLEDEDDDAAAAVLFLELHNITTYTLFSSSSSSLYQISPCLASLISKRGRSRIDLVEQLM